ncbi:2OG-Fe(II) oxygenase [Psychroflexus sp. YR1-1]|uniref:2OG-Fe(II) oxygenase n=1 Tax=Psychroflexus aurantiacus TaxID=2709310 RepID=A0A6B3R1N1_9FLAO|nr:2OG-Fe(II) oxygenase [Psychroflexus aurantiacus]NEV92957.1 2OG-Fe(II) oxygenase [Psychroflexus aurantiacus]
MRTELLTDALSYEEHPLYERIISDILDQGYSICDSFFEEPTVNSLREEIKTLYRHSELKKAGIGNKLNESVEKSIRGDYIQWIDEQKANAVEKGFFDRINAFKNYLNKTCFMGLLHQEFHYAVYPKGTFYKKHIDTFQNDDRRKLSLVCYLNDDSWKTSNGGELVLYPEGLPEVVVHPLPGRVVIFESQRLEHEVKAVIQDKRLSITGWLKTR